MLQYLALSSIIHASIFNTLYIHMSIFFSNLTSPIQEYCRSYWCRWPFLAISRAKSSSEPTFLRRKFPRNIPILSRTDDKNCKNSTLDPCFQPYLSPSLAGWWENLLWEKDRDIPCLSHMLIWPTWPGALGTTRPQSVFWAKHVAETSSETLCSWSAYSLSRHLTGRTWQPY